ncbi:MAG TPA: hypothetical protein VGM51_07230 [Armatimonadota bacterium]|jgi:hypothetical protein
MAAWLIADLSIGLAAAATRPVLPVLTWWEEHIDHQPILAKPMGRVSWPNHGEVEDLLWYAPQRLLLASRRDAVRSLTSVDLTNHLVHAVPDCRSSSAGCLVLARTPGPVSRIQLVSTTGTAAQACDVDSAVLGDTANIMGLANDTVLAAEIQPSVSAAMQQGLIYTLFGPKGQPLLKGHLPRQLGVSLASVRGIRRSADGYLWAVPSFKWAPGTPEQWEGPTEVSIVRMAAGSTTLVRSISRSDLPVPPVMGFLSSNSLDSPTWLPGSTDILVFRRRWCVYTSGANAEMLSVQDLLALPLRGQPTVLDMVAEYQGPRGLNLSWEADEQGAIQESYRNEALDLSDLVPVPALVDGGIAYKRHGRIIYMRVPR